MSLKMIKYWFIEKDRKNEVVCKITKKKKKREEEENGIPLKTEK